MIHLIGKYLDRLGKNWDTIAGLKDHSILIILLTLVSFISIHGYKIYVLSAGLVFLTAFYSIWKFKRLIKFIIFNRINIVFCFYNVSSSAEVERYLKNFQSEFLIRLQNFNLKRIKVSFLPTDRRIQSRQEAETLVQNGYLGQTLIVWGELTETSQDIKCSNINFTYELATKKYFPNLSFEKVKDWFTQETQKSINSYSWNLNLKNRIELESYTDNIKDIALYTLARTLLTVGMIEDGTEMLVNLLKTLQSLALDQVIKRSSIISEIKKLLAYVNLRMAEISYYKKDWLQMESRLNESLKYDQKSYPCNLLMAYYQEMVKGDEKGSLKHLLVAENNRKHGQNGYMLSKAYFELKNEKFEQAVNIYKMLKRSTLDTNPVMLAENLRETYEKRKSLQFLFAEGFIKLLWLPDDNGKTRLKQFLKATETQQEKFKPLREEAIAILSDPEYKTKRFNPKRKKK